MGQKDSNGRTYFTDPVSNEWYRDSGTGLQRMDTMEKIFVATQQEAHDKLSGLKAVSAESLSAHQQWEMMGFMDFVNVALCRLAPRRRGGCLFVIQRLCELHSEPQRVQSLHFTECERRAFGENEQFRSAG